ncbi:MAG: hypothetical protein HY005_00970 [Candidatus Staskawiczbacteria bacterium]|nr:hypothetical protein [Candidatus Staskawiczbacteria bacterium]
MVHLTKGRLDNNSAKINYNMAEENKCPACGHEHKEEDGSCSCGCPKQ